MEKPNPLSVDGLGQIRALARQISVANHLDPEIQAELESHMEDQASAYVSGARGLTEADALLLTRAHFGKAEVIKSLLQQVHVRDYHVSLARRIVAVVCASVAVAAVTSPLNIWLNIHPNADFQLFLRFFSSAGGFLGLLGLLLYWRWRIRQQRPVWFQRLSPRGLALVLGGVTLLYAAWMHVGVSVFYHYVVNNSGPPRIRASMWPGATLIVVALILNTLDCMLWLWWTDDRPRSRYGVVCTALAWLGYEMYIPGTGLMLTWTLFGMRSTQVILWVHAYSMGFKLAVVMFAALVYVWFTRRIFARPAVAS